MEENGNVTQMAEQGATATPAATPVVTPPQPIKVKSKAGYVGVPKTGFGGEVLAILISIFLIIGALSGRLVLRGTNSSTALLVVAFGLLAWDVYNVIKKTSKISEQKTRLLNQNATVERVMATSREMPTSLNVRISYDKRFALVDFTPRLNGVKMTRNPKSFEYTGVTGRSRNIIDFEHLELTVVWDVAALSEVSMQLQQDGKQFELVLPSNVTYLPPV